MLTIEDAKDIIDIYGPHRKDWPPVDTPAMDALIKGEKELGDYLRRQRAIDAMLNNWDEDLDGANIEFEDDELDGLEDDELDEEEQDEERGSDPETDEDQDDGDSGSDTDADEDNEPEDEQSQDEPDAVEEEGGSPCVEAEPDEEEELTAIRIDADDIQDMDDKFSARIKELIDLRAGNTFNVFSRDKDGFVDITVPQNTTLEPIDQAVMSAVGPLMKDLRRMIAARSQVRRIPGKRSGRLHSASLHRIKLGDDRVFSRKEETPSLNTAITLLIDTSGSMNCGRLKLATETAYALGTVLNKLGIAFECIGFTDAWPNKKDFWPFSPEQQQWYDEAHEAAKEHPIGRLFPLCVARWKSFEDRWTIPTQKRFAAVFADERNVQQGGTPEACGLEFAAKRLLQRSEDRKILICMTDGEPGSSSCNQTGAASGTTREEGKSDMQHSKDTVASITAAGIDLVGIGIQHQGPTRYYPNSLVIQNVGEMPKLLMGVLKRFIVG